MADEAEEDETRVVGVGADGHTYGVTTVRGKRECTKRRTPCAECPWKKDQVGRFPSMAFLESARTGYDMSQYEFACHMDGIDNPRPCVGFLLKGSDHNLGVRLASIAGRIDMSQIGDGGHELFEDYYEMAVANGVDPSHPDLAPIRRAGS